MSAPQSPGQMTLPLWPALHPCPVCSVDRMALGHYWTEMPNQAPYDVEDLIQHLGACPRSDADEIWIDVF